MLQRLNDHDEQDFKDLMHLILQTTLGGSGDARGKTILRYLSNPSSFDADSPSSTLGAPTLTHSAANGDGESEQEDMVDVGGNEDSQDEKDDDDETVLQDDEGDGSNEDMETDPGTPKKKLHALATLAARTPRALADGVDTAASQSFNDSLSKEVAYGNFPSAPQSAPRAAAPESDVGGLNLRRSARTPTRNSNEVRGAPKQASLDPSGDVLFLGSQPSSLGPRTPTSGAEEQPPPTAPSPEGFKNSQSSDSSVSSPFVRLEVSTAAPSTLSKRRHSPSLLEGEPVPKAQARKTTPTSGRPPSSRVKTLTPDQLRGLAGLQAGQQPGPPRGQAEYFPPRPARQTEPLQGDDEAAETPTATSAPVPQEEAVDDPTPEEVAGSQDAPAAAPQPTKPQGKQKRPQKPHKK